MPSEVKVYNSLTGKKNSNKDYEYAVNVCNAFEMKTMKDYHEFYSKCDVLLLADVSVKFRNNS